MRTTDIMADDRPSGPPLPAPRESDSTTTRRVVGYLAAGPPGTTRGSLAVESAGALLLSVVGAVLLIGHIHSETRSDENDQETAA
jgi:hypothetical protein